MTIQPQHMLVNQVRMQRVQNSFSGVSGALGEGDRGAWQDIPEYTGNPYDSQSYIYRWRQYCHLYETSWEARKIVRIPVEDALRKPWSAQDISNQVAEKINKRLERLNFNAVLSRSLMLERLLGGCLTFMGIEENEDAPSREFHPSEGKRVRFFNAIPISRISRMNWETNPLKEGYMRPKDYTINGVVLHISRCIVWDGEPLFDPYDFMLTNFRANLSGFGPSKLAPIWDDIIKAKGTRQAAYQLIQTNNAIIMAVNELQDLSGTKSGKAALLKLKEIANQISVYRAAMIQKDKVEITQSAASFGSVPELIITFIQILSAASDIPATRFLGQAPGGLNATGESDLENYYNMIDAFQRQRIEPAIRRVYDVVGYNLFPNEWKKERETLTFKFPPLWNLDELEEADRNSKVLDNCMKVFEQGLMGEEKVIQEINKKNVFSIKLDQTDIDLTREFDESLPPLNRPDLTSNKANGDHGRYFPTLQSGSLPTNLQQLKNMNPRVLDADEARFVGKQLGVDWTEISFQEFMKGMIVEKEHSDLTGGDPIATGKITLAHLRERKDYYSRLEQFVENAVYIPLSDYPEPTDAQKSAGNYRKHHLRLHGLDFSIENPMGSERRGKRKDGTPWSSILPAHYGYVRRTEGADGDHVDAYLGPHEESELVFVIDQKDPDTCLFDEHKTIFGALSMTQAKALYLDAFSDGKGPARIGAITPLTIDKFKQWLREGDTKKPYAMEVE